MALSEAVSPEGKEGQGPPKNEAVKLKKLTVNDFVFGKLIGEGSFSMVLLAKETSTTKHYAVKICEKALIRREKKEDAIMRERDIMYILNGNPSPFIIRLYATFQDAERLYFVMNYAKNGELLSLINKSKCFDEASAVFYGAEILMAIEHLHKSGIVHRDVKPENILLDDDMHVQLSDFGSASLDRKAKTVSQATRKPDDSNNSSRRNSFVGTAQYVSPEMLSDKKSSPSSDLWAFGCILYQMVAGVPPFRASTEYLIFQKILKLEYDFPDGFNLKCKNLVEDLLKLNPTERLGSSDDLEKEGYCSVKSNRFFQPIKERFPTLHLEKPPKILRQTGSTENGNINFEEHVPEDLEPGLNERQLARILRLSLEKDIERARSSLVFDAEEMEKALEDQRQTNPYHPFVENNLIIKQGLVSKRKGLFAKRRMLILTTGPHLYYFEPSSRILKGEIPWSPDIKPEPKGFNTFLVHTPNRTYYLEDVDGAAPDWCRVIEEVRDITYAGKYRTCQSSESRKNNAKKENGDNGSLTD